MFGWKLGTDDWGKYEGARVRVRVRVGSGQDVLFSRLPSLEPLLLAVQDGLPGGTAARRK